MTDFLPPIIAEIKADLSDLIAKLTAGDVAITAWANNIPNDLKSIEGSFGKAGHDAGAALVDEVKKELGNLDNEEPRIKASGHRLGTMLAQGFKSGFSVLGRAVLPLGPMGTMWGSLIGAAAPLVGPLVQSVGLLGLVPAAAAGAAAGIGTLVSAFHGLGAALSAGALGDMKKYQAALAKLAPSAQDAARAIVSLHPLLQSLHRTIQQNFFTGFASDLRQIGNTFLPMLRTELGGVASDMNTAFKSILDSFNTPDMLDSVRTSLQGIRGGLAGVVNVLPGLVSGFTDFIEAGSKFLPDLGRGLAGLGDAFSAWAARVTTDGTFKAWIDNAFAALKQLGFFLQDLGSIVVSLFQAMGAAGDGTLGIIGTLVRQLAQFFRTKEGMAGLVAVFRVLGDLATFVGRVILDALPLVAKLLGPIAQAADALLPVLVSVADTLAAALLPVINALGPAFLSVVAALMPFIGLIAGQLGRLLIALGPVIAQLVTQLGQYLAAAFDALLPAFAQLLPALVDLAIQLLPLIVPLLMEWTNLLIQLMPYIGQFASVLAEILVPAIHALTATAAGNWIEDVATWFGRLGAAAAGLGTQIGTFVSNVTSGFLDWLKSIPGFVSGILDDVGGFFTLLGQTIADFAVSVGDWFAQLPGVILGAIEAIPGLITTAVEGIAYAIGYYAGLIVKGLVGVFWVLPNLIAKYLKKVPGVVMDMLRTVGQFIGRLPGLFITAVATVGQTLVGWRNNVVTWLIGLVSDVAQFLAKIPAAAVALGVSVVGAVVQWAKDLKTTFSKLWGDIVKTAEDWYRNVLKFFTDLGPATTSLIKGLGPMLKDAAKDAWNWLYNAGKDVIHGLIQGIKDQAQDLYNTVGDLAHNVASGFKNALGIHSPSTVFNAFGGHIVAGLVQGVNSNAHLATSAVSRMLAGLNAGPVSVGAAAFGGGGYGSGGGYVPIHVNLGGKHMATLHAALIPTAQRYKQRAGTTGLT